MNNKKFERGGGAYVWVLNVSHFDSRLSCFEVVYSSAP